MTHQGQVSAYIEHRPHGIRAFAMRACRISCILCPLLSSGHSFHPCQAFFHMPAVLESWFDLGCWRHGALIDPLSLNILPYRIWPAKVSASVNGFGRYCVRGLFLYVHLVLRNASHVHAFSPFESIMYTDSKIIQMHRKQTIPDVWTRS